MGAAIVLVTNIAHAWSQKIVSKVRSPTARAMESVTTEQKYQIIAFSPGMTDFQRIPARTRRNSAYEIGQ